MSAPSDAQSAEVRLDVLRDDLELSFGVRLRIAIDVLVAVAETGAPLVGRPPDSRMRLENVRIRPDGAAIVTGTGSSAGSAELVWEILARRRLDAARRASLCDVVAGDGRPEVAQVVDRALSPSGGIRRHAELATLLEEAGRGYLDTREDVRHAFGLDERVADPDPTEDDPSEAQTLAGRGEAAAAAARVARELMEHARAAREAAEKRSEDRGETPKAPPARAKANAAVIAAADALPRARNAAPEPTAPAQIGSVEPLEETLPKLVGSDEDGEPTAVKNEKQRGGLPKLAANDDDAEPTARRSHDEDDAEPTAQRPRQAAPEARRSAASADTKQAPPRRAAGLTLVDEGWLADSVPPPPPAQPPAPLGVVAPARRAPTVPRAADSGPGVPALSRTRTGTQGAVPRGRPSDPSAAARNRTAATPGDPARDRARSARTPQAPGARPHPPVRPRVDNAAAGARAPLTNEGAKRPVAPPARQAPAASDSSPGRSVAPSRRGLVALSSGLGSARPPSPPMQRRGGAAAQASAERAPAARPAPSQADPRAALLVEDSYDTNTIDEATLDEPTSVMMRPASLMFATSERPIAPSAPDSAVSQEAFALSTTPASVRASVVEDADVVPAPLPANPLARLSETALERFVDLAIVEGDEATAALPDEPTDRNEAPPRMDRVSPAAAAPPPAPLRAADEARPSAVADNRPTPLLVDDEQRPTPLLVLDKPQSKILEPSPSPPPAAMAAPPPDVARFPAESMPRLFQATARGGSEVLFARRRGSRLTIPIVVASVGFVSVVLCVVDAYRHWNDPAPSGIASAQHATPPPTPERSLAGADATEAAPATAAPAASTAAPAAVASAPTVSAAREVPTHEPATRSPEPTTSERRPAPPARARPTPAAPRRGRSGPPGDADPNWIPNAI